MLQNFLIGSVAGGALSLLLTLAMVGWEAHRRRAAWSNLRPVKVVRPTG